MLHFIENGVATSGTYDKKSVKSFVSIKAERNSNVELNVIALCICWWMFWLREK